MSSKSQILERKVYDCIDELCDKFDLPVVPCPEVYWARGDFSFRDIGLRNSLINECLYVKEKGDGYFFPDENIVFLFDDSLDVLAEESTHVVHLLNSLCHKSFKGDENDVFIRSLVEMLGFFGSKLFMPERQNSYFNIPCPFSEKEKFGAFAKEIGRNLIELMIHKSGYDLGDKLYNAYISGLVSKDYIHELFLMDFKEKNSAAETFLQLKFYDLNFEGKKFLSK